MDSWAIEVLGRLQLCNDLSAVGAACHSTCCNRFFSVAKHPCDEVHASGRSVDSTKENSFLNMCSMLEKSEAVQFGRVTTSYE